MRQWSYARETLDRPPLMWAALNDHEQVIAELLAVDVTEQHLARIRTFFEVNGGSSVYAWPLVCPTSWVEKVAVVPEG